MAGTLAPTAAHSAAVSPLASPSHIRPSSLAHTLSTDRPSQQSSAGGAGGGAAPKRQREGGGSSSVLDIEKYIDQRVRVKFHGGREGA